MADVIAPLGFGFINRRDRPPAMTRRIVDVLVPVALDAPYSYCAPAELALAVGDIVRVPLGPRQCIGVVWSENAAPDPRLDNRLRDVAEKLDVPPLREELRAFINWVAGYTLSPRGMVLRMALRMGEQLGGERVRPGVRLAGAPPRRLTQARTRVLAMLADGLARAKGDAARQAGVSPGVLDSLIDEGTLELLELPAAPVAPAPDPGHAVPDFTADQAEAGAALRAAVGAGGFSGNARRRRDRRRQNRGLFRGGRRSDYAWPPDADPDAGDRPHGAVS